MIGFRPLLSIMMVVGLIACGQGESESVQPLSIKPSPRLTDKPQIYVSNYPLHYFATRLGGDSIGVIFPASTEIDPATWKPTVEEILLFQQADLILFNGAGYESWAANVTLPEGKLVDTSAAFSNDFIPVKAGLTHSHGLKGEHSHGNVAFTTWLDMQQAILQAEAVRAALDNLLPNSSSQRQQRFEALVAELEALDKQYLAAAEKLAGAPVLFSHPVYQYFSRRYQLNGRSVHWEPGELPDEAQWRMLDQLLLEHSAKWMIWEDEPLPETRQQLAARGVQTVVVAPQASQHLSSDLITEFSQSAEAWQQQIDQAN